VTTSAPNLPVRTVAEAQVIEVAHADLTDAAFIHRIGDGIYQLVKDLDRPKVVIDFQKVERLSSAALGMLVALKKVLDRQNGQLRVANVCDSVFDVFTITKLDKVLNTCKTTEEAVGSFRP
jgi:anti-anti-sigma factor